MSEQAKKGALGEILSTSQIITESDILAALEEQKRAGCRFGEALVNLGAVSQEDVDWALSNQLDIPFIRLKKDMIDPEAIALIPADMARAFACVPLFLAGDELNIAIADPLNRSAIETIELQTGLRISISVAMIREIRALIDECYGLTRDDGLGFESTTFSDKVLSSINADLSGGKLLDGLLISILKNQFSSLSLQPFSDKVVVCGRRSGLTREIGTLGLGRYPDFVRKVRLCASLAPDGVLASTGSIDFAYRSRVLTFQAALLPGEGYDYITLTPQVDSNFPERLSVLDLPQNQISALSHLARASQGITFFAAHSMRERSSFMDLMLEEAETEGKSVIIFGNGPGRMQKSFPRIPLPHSEPERARLIVDSLDHDPDILVIEDATEGMPFGAACRAAMRGKLVLAGLGISSSRNVLRQLLLYQQSNRFLPLFVNGLVSISGILILCPSCRTEYVPTRGELAAMRLEHVPPVFYRSSGCDACGQSGFLERRFLLDVMAFDDEFLRVLGQASDVSALEACLTLKGCQGIAAQGLRLLMEGSVSPEEYIAVVVQ